MLTPGLRETRLTLCKKFVRDQTGQRSDQRAKSTDVDASEKRRILICKSGKQNGSRNIADYLAAAKGKQKFPAMQCLIQEFPYQVNSLHIADKYKKSNESQKKAVVYLFRKKAAVKNSGQQQAAGQNNHDKHRPADHTKYRKKAEEEQCRQKQILQIPEAFRNCIPGGRFRCFAAFSGSFSGRLHMFQEFRVQRKILMKYTGTEDQQKGQCR